jgi:hypothetical protein
VPIHSRATSSPGIITTSTSCSARMSALRPHPRNDGCWVRGRGFVGPAPTGPVVACSTRRSGSDRADVGIGVAELAGAVCGWGGLLDRLDGRVARPGKDPDCHVAAQHAAVQFDEQDPILGLGSSRTTARAEPRPHHVLPDWDSGRCSSWPLVYAGCSGQALRRHQWGARSLTIGRASERRACCFRASNWIARIDCCRASVSASWSRIICGSMLGDPVIAVTSSRPTIRAKAR